MGGGPYEATTEVFTSAAGARFGPGAERTRLKNTVSSDDPVARLRFLEAVYSWELAEDRWLHEIMEAGAAVWGQPKFAFSYVYDASDTSKFHIGEPAFIADSPLFGELLGQALVRIKRLPAEAIAAAYRTVPIGFGRPIGVIDEGSSADMARYAATDIFALNGLDASGIGCAIGLGVDRTTLTSGELLVFHRLSAHLASAYRCRRRLQEQRQSAIEGWEALVHPDGRVLEAVGPAQELTARAAITRAAKSMETVRRRRTEMDPTEGWLPRVRGRWTLGDAFANGKRYIVARENQTAAPGLSALTEREREVVASVAIGKSGKEAAYDLGISHATVRVLLGRARARLGVTTMRELFALPAIRAMRGEPRVAA
jgi:DNA-binding CsgD family transcriptional regulator